MQPIGKIGFSVLVRLAKSIDGINSFTFHSKYKIEPDQLARALQPLIQKQFVAVDGSQIFITPEGEKFLTANRFNDSSKNSFVIPEEFVQLRIPTHSFYLPNVSALDQEILRPRDL